MAFETWIPNNDGNWNTVSDWSGGVLPTAADTVVISTSTEHTVTLSQGNVTIASLSVGNDIFDLDGGSLTIGGAVSMASGFVQQAGSLFAPGTVSVTGTAQLLGGLLGGSAVFEATSLVTLANYTLSGSAQLINSNMVDETGSITLSSGSTAPAIVNEAAAVFDIIAGIAINNGSTPVSSFSNAGTLEMTATNNVTSHIYVDLTSTGLITAVAGSSLEIDGPSNSVSGTIAGTGQVSFGGGTTTIASGTTISAGTLGIYNNGTNVTFAGAETLAGTISLSGGSTLTLDGDTTASGLSDIGAADILLGSHTLTIQGAASFEQSNGSPLIAGTGKLVTLGTTTLINTGGPALVLGGSVGWINSGTVIQNQSLQIGTASGSAAAVTNQTGGVFDMTLGGIAISNGSSPVSKFSNAGTLEMTATGNVTSFVRTNLASTGLVTAVAGSNLEIDGLSNTISGAIAGTGQVSFGGGSTTIASKTAISVGTLAVYGAGTNVTFASTQALGGNLSIGGSSTLTLNGNTTVAGTLNDVGATSILLGSHTLTLKGGALFQQYYGTPFIAGSGKLVTNGTTTLNGGGSALTLGGSIAWDNAGMVMDGQSIQIGTNSGSAASIVNQAHEVFDLTVSGIVITNGSAPNSVFSNAGTLEMTDNGNRTSYIQVDLASTGVIAAVAGSNLEIDGPANSISGKITGTGQVSFGGGTTTIAGGTTLNSAYLDIYNTGTNVVLGGNETVSGAFLMAYGSILALGGNTLTLAGAATFYDYNQTPLISGPGTLATQGTTSLTGGGTALILGSGVTWDNTGVVNDAQNFQIGNSTSSSATLVNAAGAVFDITAYYLTIGNGSTPTSLFSNAGTLEMTNTSGHPSFIQTDLISTGVLSAVAGGNLEIDGPANTISGTITGTGQVSFGGGTTTVAGATSISVGTLALYDAGTDLTLGGNLTVSGAFNDSNATTILLAGHTLTLSAAAVFNQYYGTPLIVGQGTLVTRGATSVGGGSTGLVLGGTAAWNNFGMVTDGQSMQFGDSTNGTATVDNEKGGVFDIVVNGVTLSNGNTLASTFTNAGLLEMTTGGSASLAANVTNTGTVLAQSGGLALSGAVSGTGLLEVQSSGTLGFSGTVQSTETAKFLDTTGRLNVTLPSASAFGAEITGFVAGDTIDLTNISNATGTFSAGVLTFINNTSHAVVATLDFSNSPAFSFASDGHGGTLITTTTQARPAPGPVPQNLRFTGLMASEPHAALEDQSLSLQASNTNLSLADWFERAGQQVHLGTSVPTFMLQDAGSGKSIGIMAASDRHVSTDTSHFWSSVFFHRS